MTYEEIRAVRLRHPFKPFRLRIRNGDEHLIQDPTTLAISQRILAFVNSKTGVIETSWPAAAESISFVDEWNPC